MGNGQGLFLKGLLLASVLILFLPIVLHFLCSIYNAIAKKHSDYVRRSSVSRMLWFSAFLIVSVWCLRYAVGYYSILNPESDSPTLTWWEEIFNSMMHALQTFSMDEAYTDYILDGKKMVGALFGSDSRLMTVYGLYASVLNLVAPIAGGAVIFEILASVFPQVRLRFAYLKPWRKKYFFSELNSSSLTLAKSIANDKKRAVLIFTDTHIDDEKEKDYELFLAAKQCGAICIRDDLAHVAKPGYGRREYYLMDENEFGNLQTLMSLTEGKNVKYARDSQIFLFVQTDAYVRFEKCVYQNLEKEDAKKYLKRHKKPTIIPINGIRNLVHNLLRDVPLYEPLIRKKDKSRLNVAILGNGMIGTEAFLSTYWFGQMLISDVKDGKRTMEQCELSIHVISKDSEETFWSKIDYVNPEIRKTVTVNGIEPKSELLSVFTQGEATVKPYCSVTYSCADLKAGEFWNEKDGKIGSLLESDYFIVALGSDADNVSIAEKLRCAIGKKHLEDNQSSNDAVIAYAVFDSKLSEALNGQGAYQYHCKGKTDVFMYSFGSLAQIYSCDNVYMSKSRLLQQGAERAYATDRSAAQLLADNKKRIEKKEDGNYSYWANLARAMHMKYKVFSLGMFQESLFDFLPEKREEYEKEVTACCERYKKLAATKKELEKAKKKKQAFPAEYQTEEFRNFLAASHNLAWLEHRRWCAFTRVLGYRFTDQYEKNFSLNETNHKNMELKLHPCLVEAAKPLRINANGEEKQKAENAYLVLPREYEPDSPFLPYSDGEAEATVGWTEKIKRELKVFVERVKRLYLPYAERCDREELLAFYTKKKAHLENRLSVLQAYMRENSDQLDQLDQLTCSWSEIAMNETIKRMDDAIKRMENGEVLNGKEVQKVEAVSFYDFKKYDYADFDFD